MFRLIIDSILFSIGLSMDAFSVSIASALKYPKMTLRKKISVALTFGIFQFVMPIIGYIFINFLANIFMTLMNFTLVISSILLFYIGIKMIMGAGKNEDDIDLSFKSLMVLGVATSVDAMVVGIAFANYNLLELMIATLIIGIGTFIICLIGTYIGNFIGNKFSKHASIFGGIILIIIGLKTLLELI